MKEPPKSASPTTTDPKPQALTIDGMRHQQNALAASLEQFAMKNGMIGGSIPIEVLMPVTCAMAQWEIAIQLALGNERAARGPDPADAKAMVDEIRTSTGYKRALES